MENPPNTESEKNATIISYKWGKNSTISWSKFNRAFQRLLANMTIEVTLHKILYQYKEHL